LRGSALPPMAPNNTSGRSAGRPRSVRAWA
jgi:hypothetical protein